jgi:hypothetical protein
MEGKSEDTGGRHGAQEGMHGGAGVEACRAGG